MARRPMYWILRGHTPEPAADILAWGEFMERSEAARRVALDTIKQAESDPVHISTVFLGIDHNWLDNGLPVLFETRVFGGPLDGETYRYTTWNAAMAGHRMLLDEAVVEGKVSAWETRERIKAAAQSKAIPE